MGKECNLQSSPKGHIYLHLSQGKQVKLDQDQRELRTKFPLISNGFRVLNSQLTYIITRSVTRKSEVS